MLSEEEKREAYRTAARWFEENNRNVEAMTYYQKSEDYAAIVDIAYMFSQMVPIDKARFTLDVLEDGWASLFESTPMAYGLYARLLVSAGEVEKALTMLNETVARVENQPADKFNCRVLYGSYIALGFAHIVLCPLSGNYDFWHYFEKGDHYFTIGAPFEDYEAKGPVTSVSLSAYLCRVGGERSEDMERYLDCLNRLTPHVVHSMNGCMYGHDDLARAEVAYLRCDLKTAEKFAYQALYKAAKEHQHELESRAIFYLLRIDMQTGDYMKLQWHLKRLESLSELGERRLNPAIYDMVMSWYYAQLGQNSLVSSWLNSGFENIDASPLMIELDTVVRLRCNWAAKKYHEILAFVGSRNVDGAILMIRIEFKILEAICLYQINEKREALDALREAYELSRSNAFDMMFIEYGNKMRTLSRAAMKSADCGVPKEWLSRINKKSATYAKKLAFVISEYRKSNHLGNEIQLSPREIEILTDLYHGLSRSEIAVNRQLSINTVKSLLQIIYGKLGAETNMEVIRIALDMKLIG
jgi:ATP/maltotriose-dependent transcriptional regulator MalT